MTDLRKAAEMSLERLEHTIAYSNEEMKKIDDAKHALRQALSNEFNPDWNQVEALQESLREHMAEIQRLRQALAQPEQDELLKQGWRQCAVGQRTTQYCGIAEQARLEEREACLKEIAIELDEWNYGTNANIALNNVAANIRARSEK